MVGNGSLYQNLATSVQTRWTGQQLIRLQPRRHSRAYSIPDWVLKTYVCIHQWKKAWICLETFRGPASGVIINLPSSIFFVWRELILPGYHKPSNITILSSCYGDFWTKFKFLNHLTFCNTSHFKFVKTIDLIAVFLLLSQYFSINAKPFPVGRHLLVC